ncbi:MAG: DUF3047 domain-containing protein [Herminiimonas sp.]|nr:DUF3047 domain-containing protein [Herminiimonas sp.]
MKLNENLPVNLQKLSNGTFYRRVVAGGLLVSVTLVAGTSAVADTTLPKFSGMTAGGAITGWTTLKPSAKAQDTKYTLVRDGDKTVLKADAVGSMSGLTLVVNIDIRQTPRIRWRWKIAAPVATADLRTKTGDDYAARIYVMFDYPASKLSFATRASLKIAESIYGQKIPTAALNYVWDNRQPIGTIAPNSYTDRARMIVIESGADKVGQWVTETRDLGADFMAAFGEVPPNVVAVALATDTDNTGETAIAWYGDIEFLSAGPTAVTDKQ